VWRAVTECYRMKTAKISDRFGPVYKISMIHFRYAKRRQNRK